MKKQTEKKVITIMEKVEVKYKATMDFLSKICINPSGGVGIYSAIEADKKDWVKLITQAREEALEEGRDWYFEGDELVIKKGKWIIDRYKKHEPKLLNTNKK